MSLAMSMSEASCRRALLNVRFVTASNSLSSLSGRTVGALCNGRAWAFPRAVTTHVLVVVTGDGDMVEWTSLSMDSAVAGSYVRDGAFATQIVSGGSDDRAGGGGGGNGGDGGDDGNGIAELPASISSTPTPFTIVTVTVIVVVVVVVAGGVFPCDADESSTTAVPVAFVVISVVHVEAVEVLHCDSGSESEAGGSDTSS